MDLEAQNLTALRNQMTDQWFSSLQVGDTVYNYSLKWHNKQIVDKKLRVGVVKEIHNNGQFSRYVVVDNLTTGRQNKWNDFDLVQPKEIDAVSEKLSHVLSDAIYLVREKPDTAAEECLARGEYERLVKNAEELLKNSDVQRGKCSGIYGAFNKDTGECIYIGKSQTSISARWREHTRFWKKLTPVHRQPLLTQYLYFFSDQIMWKVLLPIESHIDNDLIEYSERRVFEQYKPIANSIIPNGTYYGRSVLEGDGESVSVSEWNPGMVTIKIHKGRFDGFSDGEEHFV